MLARRFASAVSPSSRMVRRSSRRGTWKDLHTNRKKRKPTLEIVICKYGSLWQELRYRVRGALTMHFLDSSRKMLPTPQQFALHDVDPRDLV